MDTEIGLLISDPFSVCNQQLASLILSWLTENCLKVQLVFLLTKWSQRSPSLFAKVPEFVYAHRLEPRTISPVLCSTQHFWYFRYWDLCLLSIHKQDLQTIFSYNLQQVPAIFSCIYHLPIYFPLIYAPSVIHCSTLNSLILILCLVFLFSISFPA